jgi:hypothetical protein
VISHAPFSISSASSDSTDGTGPGIPGTIRDDGGGVAGTSGGGGEEEEEEEVPPPWRVSTARARIEDPRDDDDDDDEDEDARRKNATARGDDDARGAGVAAAAPPRLDVDVEGEDGGGGGGARHGATEGFAQCDAIVCARESRSGDDSGATRCQGVRRGRATSTTSFARRERFYRPAGIDRPTDAAFDTDDFATEQLV